MLPCCCVLLANAALLFMTFGGCPAVVYYCSRPRCRRVLLFGAVLLINLSGPAGCCSLPSGAALLLFIIVFGPPCLLFFEATLFLFITRQCRLAAVYNLPMPPRCCLLLANAALLFITFQGHPVAVYCVFGAALFIASRGHPALAYYSPVPPRCCLLLVNAAPVLFITRQCRPVAYY